MKDVLVVGASGLAKEVLTWCVGAFNVVGYTTPSNSTDNQFGLPGLSFTDDDVTPDVAGTEHVIFAIGSPKIRKKLHMIYQKKGFKFPNLIHPSSVVSTSARLGEGVVIAPNCVVSADVKIGNLSTILANSTINHDSVLEEFAIVCSNVAVSGAVKVGKSCYLGAGSSIRQNVTIGERSLLGIGSVVLNNVMPDSVCKGNPAVFLRANCV